MPTGPAFVVDMAANRHVLESALSSAKRTDTRMVNFRELLGRPRGERPSIRRINKIAKHIRARSYLEIGVNLGLTFNGLDFERKVAVDPNFRFDTAEYRREGVEFHPMTSDRYFTEHGFSQMFDIIFLDGLHTFQQTLRDFCNSLSCAHDHTVWLIDDVYPTDVYSAWPNQAEAVNFRKEAGGNSPAWHGDVFKVMFAIHDFFPMFTYVTLGAGENIQALVWRAPRVGFSPIFNSMEAIERLSYFDLLGQQGILNLKSENDGLDEFFAFSSKARISEANTQEVATE